MASGFPFRRIFIANPSASIDVELLRYGARLAALGGQTQVVVGSLPASAMDVSAARQLSEIFPAAGASVSHHPLAGADAETVIAAVAAARADLLLIRHPLRWPEGRRMARRLLEESPCSVWMVPEGAHPHLRRVVAEIGFTHADLPALQYACALGRCAGSKALLAVHVTQVTTSIEETRLNRFIAVEEALARTDTGAMVCSVQVDSSHYVSRTLQRAAEQHQADLLVVTAPPKNTVRWPNTRAEADDLATTTGTALLSVQWSPMRAGWRDALRRLFASPEPAFN